MDSMISVVAGLDDTGSIALPNSARSGGLCSKLRALPSNALLQPGIWAEARSPYGRSTYSGVLSYASSPAGSPMLPYSPYSPASAPLPPPMTSNFRQHMNLQHQAPAKKTNWPPS